MLPKVKLNSIVILQTNKIVYNLNSLFSMCIALILHEYILITYLYACDNAHTDTAQYTESLMCATGGFAFKHCGNNPDVGL